jgi:D-inositol-3-phosphate glycosyltransferase
MQKKRIAIVVADLSELGGVPVVAKFLYEIINKSEKYSAGLVSISTSVRDRNSVRILSPQTWLEKIKITEEEFQGAPYRHVGANLTEIEFFRYRPRKVLDEVLSEFDLVQVVAGTPVWFHAARNFRGKVALKVATLTDIERESVLKSQTQPKKLWTQLMNKINRRLEKSAFARADAIFVENEWMKKDLERLYPEKTIMAPPGTNTDFFSPESYQKDGYILSVARFADRRKNVQMLFRSYRKLLDKMPDAPTLLLAGQTAPTTDDLAIAEELKIADRIKIHTGITLEQLRDFYRGASIFALSSNEEGFGLVIAEAMSCGLPVVSTRCGGPEILVKEDETGYLTPTGDAETFADKIYELLVEPEKRQKFGEAARRRAVENFSLEASGRVYLKTYDKLLSE